jgi:hypothetical protein
MPRKRSLTSQLYRAARLSNNTRAARKGPVTSRPRPDVCPAPCSSRRPATSTLAEHSRGLETISHQGVSRRPTTFW